MFGGVVLKAKLLNAWGYQGNNLALPVEKVEASISFYETVMGFRVLSRSDAPHKSAILGRDSVKIGLSENGGDPTQDGCAFETDNAEALFAEFRSNGLEKDAPAFDIEQRDGISWKVFYVIAPDGLCYWCGERQTQAAPDEAKS